jgi:hypothetical protein
LLIWLFPLVVCATVWFGALAAFLAEALVRGRWAMSGVVSMPLSEVEILLIPGFIFAIIVTGIARNRRRGAPDRLPFRLGAALVAGVVAALFMGTDAEASRTTSFACVYLPALITWPWGVAREAPGPLAVISESTRWRRAWGLPFMLAFGMGFGSMIGFPLAAGDALERDPVGSMGVVALFMSVAAGFVMSFPTVALAKGLGRKAPTRLPLRFVLSWVAGAVAGALGFLVRNEDEAGMALTFLLAAPVLLSWPWRSGKAEENAEENAEDARGQRPAS